MMNVKQEEKIVRIKKTVINHEEVPSHEIKKSTQQTHIYVWGNDSNG